jgi:hypothetical protein
MIADALRNELRVPVRIAGKLAPSGEREDAGLDLFVFELRHRPIHRSASPQHGGADPVDFRILMVPTGADSGEATLGLIGRAMQFLHDNPVFRLESKRTATGDGAAPQGGGRESCLIDVVPDPRSTEETLRIWELGGYGPLVPTASYQAVVRPA